eukprot:3352292-Prymnesium_polylepis.1
MNGLGFGAVQPVAVSNSTGGTMDGRGAQGRRYVNSHLLWRPVNRSRPAELMMDALARRPSPAALCALS